MTGCSHGWPYGHIFMPDANRKPYLGTLLSRRFLLFRWNKANHTATHMVVRLRIWPYAHMTARPGTCYNAPVASSCSIGLGISAPLQRRSFKTELHAAVKRVLWPAGHMVIRPVSPYDHMTARLTGLFFVTHLRDMTSPQKVHGLH